MKIKHVGLNSTVITFDGIKAGWEQWVLLRSDVHHDNPKCDQKLEKKHLDQAKECNALIIDNGDLFCAMQGKYDKRSSKDAMRPEHSQGNYLDALVSTAADFYRPYAKQFVVLGKGNHETAIRSRHETDLTDRLAAELRREGSEVLAGGYGGWVKFNFQWGKCDSRVLYHYHGTGGGGPVTRGTIQTNRIAVFTPDADIVLTGHCFDTETEILTPTGWKRYDEIVVGSDVMTLNRQTGCIEPNQAKAIHIYDDFEELVHLDHRSTSLAVTDKHGLWLGKPRREKGSQVRASWDDCDWDSYTAEEASGKPWWIKNAAVEKNEGIPISDDQVATLAWIMAEGHVAKGGYVRITQGDGPDGRLEVLEQNLAGAVGRFTKRPHKGGTRTKLTCYRYGIRNMKEESKWIFQYIDETKAPLPALFAMSHWQRKIFIDTYIMADGSVDKTAGSTGFQLASNRKDQIDFLQALCVRSGLRSTISSGNGMYYLHACEREASYIQKDCWSVKKNFDRVWCVSVENKTLIVRRKGKTAITMNTHDSWMLPIRRQRLSTQGTVYHDEQYHVRCAGYKDAWGDGSAGWEVEKMLGPKPKDAAWLRFWYQDSAIHTEITRAT